MTAASACRATCDDRGRRDRRWPGEDADAGCSDGRRTSEVRSYEPQVSLESQRERKDLNSDRPVQRLLKMRFWKIASSTRAAAAAAVDAGDNNHRGQQPQQQQHQQRNKHRSLASAATKARVASI